MQCSVFFPFSKKINTSSASQTQKSNFEDKIKIACIEEGKKIIYCSLKATQTNASVCVSCMTSLSGFFFFFDICQLYSCTFSPFYYFDGLGLLRKGGRNRVNVAVNPRKGAMQIKGHIVIPKFINGLRPDISTIVEVQADVSDETLHQKDKIDELLQIAERAESSQADKAAMVGEVEAHDVAVFRQSFIPRAMGRGQYPMRGSQSFQKGRSSQGHGLQGNPALYVKLTSKSTCIHTPAPTHPCYAWLCLPGEQPGGLWQTCGASPPSKKLWPGALS